MKANLLCYELNLLQNLECFKFICIRLDGASCFYIQQTKRDDNNSNCKCVRRQQKVVSERSILGTVRSQ